MEQRKRYGDSVNEYDVYGRKPEALTRVKELYDQEYFSRATDASDAHIREMNLKNLGKLRETLCREVKLREEHQEQMDAKAAEQKASHEADQKARVMAEIRLGFVGSDAEFERLKDQLYDNYLLNEPSRYKAALAQARRNVRPI